MKIEFFHTMNYLGPNPGDSWPAPPRICDPEFVGATYENGFIECGAALDAGFDALNFAEHHYSPKQLTPNPIVFAAVAGRKFPGAQIGVFGTDLPLNNPVRIAEEYSMLDNLLDGRLRIGMLRGTPNEYLTYGSNPWESRERYEEGTLLLKACFTEPEPFGWEGRFYRFRNIAVWPRRVQDPHPRILVSGNSKDGAIFAGRHKLDLGFSYMTAEKCAAHADIYRLAAAEAGWQPTADNLQYRHFMYVTPTDDEAQETMAAMSGGGLMSLFKGATPDTMGVMAQIGAALGGVPKHVKIDPSMAPPMVMGPPFYGSPETVLQRITEIHDVLGMGYLEVSLGTINPLQHDDMLSSLKLIGEEIIPVLHETGFNGGRR
jgi:alkanesulfonate monooxygenase SsuD/methylene tetrahydromethanopterin reductase-like flavin-dependent oxidoreductase (luciferase family)